VIGEIRLDAGPTIRLTLVEADDRDLRIGARMKGVLHQAAELRFSKEVA
jgi:hypothetical protein